MTSVSGSGSLAEPKMKPGHRALRSDFHDWPAKTRAHICAIALALAAATAQAQAPLTASQAGGSASNTKTEALHPPSAQSMSGSQTVTLSYLEGLRPSSISSVSTLGPDLFGDKVNLFNGSLQFEHTDLELPGNSSIPVALTRRYSPGRLPYVRGVFGDWDLHVPRIAGSFGEHGWVTESGGVNRCTGYSAPSAVSVGGISGSASFQYNQFWHGTTLEVPGQSADEILSRAREYLPQPNDAPPGETRNYPLVTKGHWQIRCLPSVHNAAGEGFLAISPQGVQYRFDWMASRYAGGVTKAGIGMARYDMSLYATEVRDRFGNVVRYTFNPAQPGQLQSITGSDGRVITLTYSGDLVAAASDGTRTYQYGYTAGQLTTVTRPDGSRWVFNLGGMLYPQYELLGEGAKCDSPGAFPSAATMVGVITHPSGAIGTFTTQFRTHGRTYVDRFCWYIQGTSGQTTGSVYPHYTRSQTLTRKTITGPGIPDPLTWIYEYGTVAGWNPCVGCPDRKTNTVTAPDGSVSRHVFGVRWRVNEGQLLQTDEGVRGTVTLRSTQVRYRVPSSESCPERFGTSPNAFGDFLSALNRPEDRRQIQQSGATLTWQLAAGGAGLDAMCRPLSATESSSWGHTRNTWTSYHDSTNPWVRGQLRQRVDHDGAVQTQIDYHPDTALPLRHWQYGRLVQSYEYHTHGNLWKAFDPLNRPTIWNDYHRGVARQFVHRDGAQESAIINNLGKPTSYTNAAGTTTLFGYDAMGRLNRIGPPAEPGRPYFDITDQFEQIGTDEYGLASSHWRQTTRKGNAVTVRYYDALWRARLVHTYDETQIGTTASRTVIRYDHDGRKVYESYPTREAYLVTDSPPGRWTTYDDLGREKLQQQSSELGLLNTSTEYLANLSKRVTNARGHSTTYHHQAFANPNELAIVQIELPELTWVRIDRDTQGRANAITRGGGAQALTRRYSYDAHKRLCKTVEPETGATIQWYDGAGNVGWRASGLGLTGAACDWDLVPANKRILMEYDERDRVRRTAHGDGTSTIEQSYTPDGLLAQITASRPGTNTIRWTYGYNNRRLLVQERYEWGDPANRWDFNRLIDAHGNEYALQDPHGQIDYEPNALGQPTRAGSYVTGVTYHPNGMVASHAFGNGRAFSLSLNTRGLPLDWISPGALHNRFSYDGAGNITEITDHVGGQHQSMPWYDGLDRLRHANGPWGSGSYTYDALDNLVASSVGGRNLTHVIDPATNRLTALTGSLSLGITYDDQGNVRSRNGQSYVFDLANRLTSTPGKVNNYVYDGHGRRNLTWFADGNYRHDAYTQDGKLRLSWRSGPVRGSVRYVYLGDRLVAEQTGANVVTYVHGNHLGSPVVRSDASGTVLESTRTRYEPYGATVAGSFNPTGIGFTGHVNDPEIGMVYMQQRYYDPIAGRFLSVDSVTTSYQDGSLFGRYHYASNNPYKFRDPDGRAPCTGTLIASACGTGYNTAPLVDSGAVARASANRAIAQRLTSEVNSAIRGAKNLWTLIVAAAAGDNDESAASPEIKPDELRDKTKGELESQAKDKGLVQDAKRPNKWRDPSTGRERMRIDPGHVDPKTGKPYENPRAAVPHAHGYDQKGDKIGDPLAGDDPHFPLRPY